MFNFSATSMLGSGSTAGTTRGGFSSGSMSGPGHGTSPSGTEKQPTASVSLHLHF
jgi:hypothetical protein